jgi:hypothetical protein
MAGGIDGRRGRRWHAGCVAGTGEEAVMRSRLIIPTTIAAVVAFAMVSWAQGGPPRWRGGQGWGEGGAYGRLYDPKTVETVRGEVVAVETFTPMKGMSPGVHLRLKTDKETTSVHLGPAWFIENQDVKIEAEDSVEVKGSRVTLDDRPAIIAAEVSKGDAVLRLRDERGVPFWAGWRRR